MQINKKNIYGAEVSAAIKLHWHRTLVQLNLYSAVLGCSFSTFSMATIHLRKIVSVFLIAVLLSNISSAQLKTKPAPKSFALANNSKPWVFWYWMQASVSKEGITADLEAMAENGIGGAYLMPIKGVANPPLMQPAAEQLTPRFWEMVKFSMQEAKRLGLQMGMHYSDGFALGGGPWITPEMSMQKVVWSELQLNGNTTFLDTLPTPESYKGYYKDIAIYAYPTLKDADRSSYNIQPIISTSNGADASFLSTQNNKKSFKADTACWIQYAFEKQFTCRSIKIVTNGNNYEAQRLLIQASDDGIIFQDVEQLVPARHGWQDTDADFTYSIEPFTAKYFRFVYDKKGSEAGAEDLDAAKWKPNLKLVTVELSGRPYINQYEAKNGAVWRVATPTYAYKLDDSLCISKNKLINISDKLNANGKLNWEVPPGNWTILRMGHTSTGHTNATGGGGIGLECDKFDPKIIKLQFDNWFGEAYKQIGVELASQTLKAFHVDSWECGSQNWSPVFRQEFRQRRGYDCLPYLPAMAGVPIGSADSAERFLYDVRQTIAELIHDKFYATLQKLSHEKGCVFTAESVAPTMVSDGLLHYDLVDVPMGEFWLNSPTHDKPNDMLDAISGGHIYGKNIIQAEAFTTVRMAWNEQPGMLKTLQDRNYAMGINKLVYHVFTHNPWMDRKPGMTLDGVGLYFQRDQTWWKQGTAWIDYAERCQAMLQKGKPVVDIAVFTGEEVPRRSILPDRLMDVMPGIFGEDKVKFQAARMANVGEPMAEKPDGVRYTANTYKAEDWVDPLRGYQYDCINPDALLRLATVKNGRIVLPGGASYGLLVIPGTHPMNPNGTEMSSAVANKILELIRAGGNVLISQRPQGTKGMEDTMDIRGLFSFIHTNKKKAQGQMFGEMRTYKLGKGKLFNGVWLGETFDTIGIQRDFMSFEPNGQLAESVAWTHRTNPLSEAYFISNQLNIQRNLRISLRSTAKFNTLYDAVSHRHYRIFPKVENGRTIFDLELAPNASIFVVLHNKPNLVLDALVPKLEPVVTLNRPWEVVFDTAMGGPSSPVMFAQLSDWKNDDSPDIKYYSGTATYSSVFDWPSAKAKRVWLDLGAVHDIASVSVNGIDCGTVWTFPFRINISNAVKLGPNQVVVTVTNTWANRIIGDHQPNITKPITNTTAPFRLEGKPLNPAGLLGPVTIQISN